MTSMYYMREVLIAERAYEYALRACERELRDSEGFSIRASDGFPDLAPAPRPPHATSDISPSDSGAPP